MGHTLHSGSSSLRVGDIVSSFSGSSRGRKIVKITELNDTLYAIYRTGSIKGNKFIPDGMTPSLYDLVSLANNYSVRWVPDTFTTAPGDILKDQDDVYYTVRENDAIWRLTSGTYASLRYWTETEDRVFEQVLTATQDRFSTQK